MNLFGPWNKTGAKGVSYNGADYTKATSDATYDNLDYVAFLVRDYNTGGVAYNVN